MNSTYSIKDKVINVLVGQSMTADEVATKINESILAVRPTICGLYKDGAVKKTGDKRNNISGKAAHVWEMKCIVNSDSAVKTTAEVPNPSLSLVAQAKKIGFDSNGTRELLKSEMSPDTLEMAIKQVFAS